MSRPSRALAGLLGGLSWSTGGRHPSPLAWGPVSRALLGRWPPHSRPGLYTPYASHPANISDLQTRQLWLREERPPCSESQGRGVAEASCVLTPEPGSFSEWQKQYRLLAIQRPLIPGGTFWPCPCCYSEFTASGVGGPVLLCADPSWAGESGFPGGTSTCLPFSRSPTGPHDVTPLLGPGGGAPPIGTWIR